MNKTLFVHKLHFRITEVIFTTAAKHLQSCDYRGQLLLLVHGDDIHVLPLPEYPTQPRRVRQFPLAVAGGDVVKHGVQAGVEDDQSHGEAPGVVDDVCGRAALDDLHALQQVQQVDHVVRQEAQQRYGQDGVDDSHGFSGRSRLYLGDAPGGQRVTHYDDQGGQQGAEREAQHAVPHQTRGPLVSGEILEASAGPRRVRFGLQRPHEDKDQYSHSNSTPEDCTDYNRAPGTAHPQIGVWMDCCHVAIHTDTGHEADAHVDVGKEQKADDPAGNVPKLPVVAVEVVVDLKR